MKEVLRETGRKEPTPWAKNVYVESLCLQTNDDDDAGGGGGGGGGVDDAGADEFDFEVDGRSGDICKHDSDFRVWMHEPQFFMFPFTKWTHMS